MDIYSVLVEYYDFRREEEKTSYYKKKLRQLVSSEQVDRSLGPPSRRKSRMVEFRASIDASVQEQIEKQVKNVKMREDIKDRVIGTNLQLQAKTIENK